MKKLTHRLITAFLAFALLFSFTSCGKQTGTPADAAGGNDPIAAAEGDKSTKAPKTKKGNGSALSIRQATISTFPSYGGLTSLYSTHFYIDTSGVAHVKRSISEGFQAEISNAKTLFMLGAYYVLKEDNSLWGLGSNNDGQLGDGTGVDHFDKFVKIADDVVNVFGLVDTFVQHTCFLKSDGTLWGFGNFWKGGEEPVYAPEQLDSNVVDCVYAYIDSFSLRLLSLSVDGELKVVKAHNVGRDASDQVGRVLANDVQFVSGNSFISNGNLFEITSGDVKPAEYGSVIPPEIANSIALFSHESSKYRSGSYAIQTLDGQLWGAGKNEYGELGNGTRVPLNDFTKLFDNVAYFQFVPYSKFHYYLDSAGDLYYWTRENPSPSVVLSSVAAIRQNGNELQSEYCLVLTTDGVLKMVRQGELGDPDNVNTVEISNVKLP